MDAPVDLAGVLRHLGRGMTLIRSKAEAYVEGRDYYTGRRAEVHASPKIAALLSKSASAFPLSLAHIPVDALLDRVDLAAIEAPGNGAAELEKLLGETGYVDEVDDWHTKAGYFGDYYVMLDPLDEDDDGVAGTIELVGASPLTTVVVYDSRTGRKALYGVRLWHEATDEHGGVWRASVFYDDCTIRLVTHDGMSSSANVQSTDFAPDLDDDDTPGSERIPHVGGVMLLEHFAVDGRPYGRPLHSKAYGPQDALTKYNATGLAIADGAGFPIRYGLLDPEAELDDDDADDFDADFDSSGGDAKPREGKTRLDPGSIQYLRGLKAVGTFQAAQPNVFLENQDWYVRAMAVATGTPVFEFDSKSGEQPSGEARRRAEARIVRHAERVVRDLTRSHRRLVAKLLALRGVAVDPVDVDVAFAPLETSSDAEGIELVSAKVKAGVPPRVALLEAGYPATQVDDWFPEGDDAALSIDAAAALAPALSQLGQAVTLGTITAEEARAMLPRFLTGARGEGPALDAVETVVPADDAGADALQAAQTKRALLEAQGVGARAGAQPEELAAWLGIEGVTFPNIPTTVRVPEDVAAELEGGGAAPSPASPPPEA